MTREERIDLLIRSNSETLALLRTVADQNERVLREITDPGDWVNTEEACRMLGVTAPTLRAWAAKGLVVCDRKSQRKMLWLKSSLKGTRSHKG